MTSNEWFHPRGTLTRDGWESVVDQARPGWEYTGLRIAELGDGLTRDLPASDAERLVVPLAGSFAVVTGDTRTVLTGRESVFDGPTDVYYLGARTGARIEGRGRVAVAEARTTRQLPNRYLSARDCPVEIRGTGRDTRQVHGFGFPGTLDAAALIVCEVITPAGNWSSHPAHKHDDDRPGHESRLEEIYYFQAAPARQLGGAPDGTDPFGGFATYTSDAGEIETNALVRTGDIALVPYGYHGPAMAAPEYDLYYLNVMAGPRREWLISDDPRQAWVRGTWASSEPDPRLPYGPGAGGPR